MTGRIVIVTGPPGVGKSTIARILADQSPSQRSLHMHTDDFYLYIRKGYIEPWLQSSNTQNMIVLEASAASAQRFATGGYDVYVDGVVGPWFLAPWMTAVDSGIDTRYVVLRPSEKTTIARASARTGELDLVDSDVVGILWRQFADLGEFERYAIDTTELEASDVVLELQKRLVLGEFKLSSEMDV